jgi:hypothetical protein
MNKSLQIAGVSIVSAAVGLAIGYKVAEKRLTAQFEERLQNEEELMRVYFTTNTQVKKYKTPEEAVADLIPEEELNAPEAEKVVDPRERQQKVQYNKIVTEQKYDPADHFDEAEQGALAAEEVLVRKNVFNTPIDKSLPYVISQDDFMGNATGFDQATLTYYSDGTLSDEKEDIIEDQRMTVGVSLDVRFGEESSDENTVHIRNESLRMEFEVVRSDRSYAEDVLGQGAVPETPQARLRREG